MGITVTAVLLAALTALQGVGTDRLAVGEDGRIVVHTPGKADVSVGIFLWYDNWIWRTPGPLRPVGPGRWEGRFTKREQDGPGAVRLTQTVRREQDALRVEYAFEREGRMELTRGIFLSLSLAFPDYAGRRIVCTHGPPGTTDERFALAARGCAINLSEGEALEIRPDGATLFECGPDSRHAFFRMRLVPRDMGPEATAAVSLRIVPAVKEVTPWKSRPQSAPLRIAGARADRRQVGLYEPIEFTVDLSAAYDNPFDPEQVALEATFETPSGRRERLPGFYYQGFAAEYEGELELLRLDGPPAWKVRYAPREPGRYRVRFEASDRSGSVEWGPLEFRCVPSDEPGFVRIGPERPGPRYFQRDDGRSVFLIGHNVVSYHGDMDRVFQAMAQNGENYTRLWMWSQSLGIEQGLPVGRYRLAEAWRLDRALRLAREAGMLVMLCLDTHQDFREGGWSRNPYNAANGGPCAKPLDFFTDARARQFYKKRLRYLVGRYGYQTSLLCWELGNEMEGWPGSQEHKDIVARWHAEMAAELHRLDPFAHPVTSSLWTTEGWPELWNLPGMDFIQSHYYANSRWADMAGRVADICRQKLRDYPGRLHVFAEYGISSGAGTRKMDPGGVHLHNGNWAALMSGAASNPVSWWHDSYIDALGLYRVYAGIGKFVSGEDLAGRQWRPAQVESVAYVSPPARLSFRDALFQGTASAWSAPLPEGTRFVIQSDGTVARLDKLPTLLHGMGHAELRSPFVFQTDCPRPWRFAVNVGTVSAGAVLKFAVDGKTVRTVELPTGEGLGVRSEWVERWSLWQTTYDRSYEIEVPAGRHTVAVENDGRDWVQINYFRCSGYVTDELPPLRAVGLVSADLALLWFQNKAHTWFNVRDRVPIPPVAPVRVSLAGLTDGTWRVEHWDSVQGRIIRTSQARATDGMLELALPAIRTDLPIKLVRETQ